MDKKPKIYIQLHKAKYGDAFVINLIGGRETSIVIDMGLKDTYEALKRVFMKHKKIDLLVFTHIDKDHIEGGIELYKDKECLSKIRIDEVWYNTYRNLIIDDNREKLNEHDKKILSKIKQSIDLDEEINDYTDVGVVQATTLGSQIFKYNRKEWNKSFYNGGDGAACIENMGEEYIWINDEVKIILLGPNKHDLMRLKDHWINELRKKKQYKGEIVEDKIFDDIFEMMYLESYATKFKDISSSNKVKKISPTNVSSIAFIIEFYEYKLLFTGDVKLSQIVESITKYYGEQVIFDVLKVPHHGSINNIDKDSLAMIDAKNYIISTDGSKHTHPDIELIEMIIEKSLPQGLEVRNLVFNYEETKEKIERAFGERENCKYIYDDNNKIPILVLGED